MRAAIGVCLLALVVVCCPLTLAAEPTEAQRQDEILKELRALHESIDELTLRVDALEKKVGKAPTAPSAPMAAEEFQAHQADPEVLAKITLPDKPTKDQVREYVAKIVAASRGQNSFSDRDPQVAMLEKVGPDNLDALLDAYSGHQMDSFHIQYAIVRLAGPQHRDLVLAALPRIPDLAQVVLTYGWQSDAKDTLIGGLQTADEYLPNEWIQAAAALRTPGAYEALKQYMIRGQNCEAAFDALKAAPDVGDLAPTVDKMWQAQASTRDPWHRAQTAQIAIPYGHVDALEYAFSSLVDPDDQFNDKRTMRTLVMRYTPARGGDQALFDWFDKNRANIVWDPAAKVYRLKEAATSPAAAPSQPPAAEPAKAGTP